MEFSVFRGAAKMENAGFERENHSSSSVRVDMGEEATMAIPPTTSLNGNGTMQCSEMCQALHQQHQNNYPEKKPPAPPESPWHRLKTIFLVGIIVFLAVWILVYTLLSQLHVL